MSDICKHIQHASVALKRALPKLVYYRRNFKFFSLKLFWSEPRFLIIPAPNPCRHHKQNTPLKVWAQGSAIKGGSNRHRKLFPTTFLVKMRGSEKGRLCKQRKKKRKTKYQLGKPPTTLKWRNKRNLNFFPLLTVSL